MDTSLPSAFLHNLSRNTDTADVNNTVQVALARLEKLISSGIEIDVVERSFATSWLQRILTRDLAESILDHAADLITSLDASKAGSPVAICNGTYQLSGATGPIAIQIREGQMGNDVHATGFCTWKSAIYLANYAEKHLELFKRAGDVGRLRVLELGSGTGYAGIAIAKLLHDSNLRAIITLSDYDEATLDRLRANVSTNGLIDEADALVRVRTRKLDWKDLSDSQMLRFDVILAADTVYEPNHGMLLQGIVRKWLHPAGAFHAVVPHRGTHVADIEAFERAFMPSDETMADTRRPIIVYSEKLPSDEAEPHEYIHYCIEWQS